MKLFKEIITTLFVVFFAIYTFVFLSKCNFLFINIWGGLLNNKMYHKSNAYPLQYSLHHIYISPINILFSTSHRHRTSISVSCFYTSVIFCFIASTDSKRVLLQINFILEEIKKSYGVKSGEHEGDSSLVMW